MATKQKFDEYTVDPVFDKILLMLDKITGEDLESRIVALERVEELCRYHRNLLEKQQKELE